MDEGEIMQTALIVDDSTLARMTLKRFLEKYDVTVFDAECAADCRQWLRHNPLPDVVFLDITMPEVDGFQVLAEIRSDPQTRELPVIMYSSDASDETKKKARNGKATGFLRKPVSEKLLGVILERLDQRQQALEQKHHEEDDQKRLSEEMAMASHQMPESPDSAGQKIEDLRHDVGKMYVIFERQQEVISSLKLVSQEQADEITKLQKDIQHYHQKNKTVIKMASLTLLLSGLLLLAALVIMLR